MKQIKYQIEIKFMSKDGKEIKLQTYASNSTELLKNIKEILDEKSKNCIMRLFN